MEGDRFETLDPVGPHKDGNLATLLRTCVCVPIFLHTKEFLGPTTHRALSVRHVRLTRSSGFIIFLNAG
jgi:hypothetical protein